MNLIMTGLCQKFRSTCTEVGISGWNSSKNEAVRKN
jgi:hypothetical protein